jgi:hypothetical protein
MPETFSSTFYDDIDDFPSLKQNLVFACCIMTTKKNVTEALG